MTRQPIIHTKIGKKPGPNTVIMAGVHGNEKSGIQAIKTYQGTPIETGQVTYIIAHPQAIQENVRQREKNLNRCFGQPDEGTQEDAIARIIEPYLQKADYLLDIHNTIQQTATPFAIVEHPEIAEILPIPTIMSGLDTLHPGGSDGYMNTIGKKGVCVEVGSIQDDIQSTVDLATQCIRAFLTHTGNIIGTNIIHTQNTYHAHSIHLSQSTNCIMSQSRKNFDYIAKGTVICDDNKSIIASSDGHIAFPRSQKQKGEEAFVWLQKK